jgi:D-tyrosyl-tRNA(Tyr) deacylase
MRVLIQRVSEATVKVDHKVVGQIGHGLLLFVGIEAQDNATDIDWLTTKIAQMRIFADKQGVMNLSLQDINGQALVISQFTLHAQTKRGNRPSYIKAAKPDIAIPLYQQFMDSLQQKIAQPIQQGVFGADMKVALINDGPVTLWLDSQQKE